jgi:hypothetical protein
VLRKISFLGLILSSTWLVIPLLPGNIEKTKASISHLSQAEFNIEKKTLERINLDKSVAVAYVDESSKDVLEDISVDKENTVDRQLALIDNTQKINTEIVENNQAKTLKVKSVQRFLSKWGGPAKYYAEDFVDAAEKYGVDYRLVAAISVVESGACKKTFKPYNCWGWGKKTFSSYEQGIHVVTAGIANKYYARGLYLPSQIGRVYAPPSKTWGSKVSSLMSQMPAYK